MSAIDDKYNALKRSGFDLGAARSAEQDAPAGGRVRTYEHGNVYWHQATGAHEVHGGILTLYLAHGGPGANPQTGARELGYPVTDEIDSPEGPRMSQFETGAIYWTPGTRGCVLFGGLWEMFKRNALGLPLTGNTPLAGGTAAYFERGVIFEAPSAVPSGHRFLVGTIDPPLMGCPLVFNPSDQDQRRWSFVVKWPTFEKATYDALTAWRPSVFADLWKERLALSPVGSPFSLLTLDVFQVRIVGQDQFSVAVETNLEVPANGPLDLRDRTLYDLQLNLPVGIPYMLSPHCLYAKKNWDEFGLFHITDLHVNRKNNQFRGQLQALGLQDAAQHYSNFQDSLRDFVRYANRLHDLGIADAVMATGDLIDFVAEDGDGPHMDNFVRLRQLLLGQPFDPGDAAGEALRIPIFMTFGNHDYRLHPYELIFSIDIPLMSTKTVSNYSSHNLIESDAVALEGGHAPSYGVSDLDKPFNMIRYATSPEIPGGPYAYFEKYFSRSRSYTVKLGNHRLVMLDTKYDDGVPGDVNAGFFISYLVDAPSIGLGVPQASKTLMGGGTPSVGISDAELGLVRQALVDAGPSGVVIVGMHAPVLSPAGHEYAYFFRETLHPTADPRLTDEFLKRRKLNGATWSKTGTPYFKVGDNTDGMDSDAISQRANEFVRVCAGVGQPRPVDLVVYGHVHDRVEFRARWNGQSNQMEYFTDFYTENPSAYYHTINALPPLAAGAPIQVRIDPQAGPNEPIRTVTRHPPAGSSAQPLTYGILSTPPYATPLNSSTDPKAWWSAHRPIFAQTSALGPMDPRQRFGTFWKISSPLPGVNLVVETDKPSLPNAVAMPVVVPDPVVQGFRFIHVRAGAIWRVHYVVIPELRARNFTMPWEDEGRSPLDTVVVHSGGVVTRGDFHS